MQTNFFFFFLFSPQTQGQTCNCIPTHRTVLSLSLSLCDLLFSGLSESLFIFSGLLHAQRSSSLRGYVTMGCIYPTIPSSIPVRLYLITMSLVPAPHSKPPSSFFSLLFSAPRVNLLRQTLMSNLGASVWVYSLHSPFYLSICLPHPHPHPHLPFFIPCYFFSLSLRQFRCRLVVLAAPSHVPRSHISFLHPTRMTCIQT